MKKKIDFSNPFKEAIETQGNRWTKSFLTALAAMAILGVTALSVNMPVVGTAAIVIAVAFFTHFISFFGLDIKSKEEDVSE